MLHISLFSYCHYYRYDAALGSIVILFDWIFICLRATAYMLGL